MSKGISRRIAAFCSVAVLSGLAGMSSAQAAPTTPASAGMSVRLVSSTGPTVKLGQAILEEYTVTPGGLAVVHETVRGAGRQVQATPVKPAAATSGRKA